MPPSILDYVARVSPGTHAIFCYENVEEAREVFISYVSGGRDRNEAVYILASSRESFEDFLQSVRLSSPHAEQRIDFLEMNKLSSKSKGLDYEATLALMKPRLDEVKRLGFGGYRIFILANDYLDYTTAEGVLQFEKQLGQNFAFPMAAICAYDLAEVGGRWDQVLLELLKAHGAHIFRGLAGSGGEVVS
ncbi:MAG TPA: MEDS domain-containing protein [Methylomirabilota bacterium]|nr:MEDS domain-containing protein [Methylomirabilota bacterium]